MKQEEKIVQGIMALYSDAKRHKEGRTKHWQECYDMFRGRHWSEARPSWKASPRLNVIYSKVQNIVPVLTNNRPRFQVLPSEPGYEEYADVMQKVMRWLWDELKLGPTFERGATSACIYGAGFYYPYWDSFSGLPKVDLIDPEMIFPDPQAVRIQDSRYIFHVCNMTLGEIYLRWPSAIGKIKRLGLQTVDVREMERYPQGSNKDYVSANLDSGTSTLVPFDLGVGESSDDPIQVLQFWVRDQSTVAVPAKFDDGSELTDSAGRKIMEETLKYPYGRCIIVAGDAVIYDEPNPFFHGKFPYVMQAGNYVDNEFWPLGIVEMLTSPQRVVNKLMGQILDNAGLMANNQWKISDNAHVDPESITGEPGLVIKFSNAERGAVVEKMDSPPMPSYVFETLAIALRSMDDISGIHQSFAGRKPEGVQSGVALDQLSEQVITRLGPLVHHHEDAITEVGEMVLSLLQQYMVGTRNVRVVDHATGEFQFVQLTPEQIRGKWELMVVAGSTVPRSREVRQREALELFDRRIIDEQGVLEHVDHPAAEKMLKRIRALQQKQAELAAMGTAGEGGPPAPGRSVQAPVDARRPQVQGRGQGAFGFTGLEE